MLRRAGRPRSPTALCLIAALVIGLGGPVGGAPSASYSAAEHEQLALAAAHLGVDHADVATVAVGVHHFLLGVGGHLADPEPRCVEVPDTAPTGPTFEAVVAEEGLTSLALVADHYCLSDEAAIRASTALLVLLVSLDRATNAEEAPTTTRVDPVTPSTIEPDVLGVIEVRGRSPEVDATHYADWITSVQQPDGAIPLHEGERRIEPYVSAWAGWGLAATGRDHDLAAAWRWLSWFRDNQRDDGSIPELERVGGQWTDTGTYDSLDGTTALFALALLETHRADPAGGDLASFEPAIERSISALRGLQQADGLLWAKPDWRVKLLMGQAEAAAGFDALRELAIELDRPDLEQQATAGRAALRAGMESLWNEEAGAYDWALHENGAREITDWGTLYPDAAAQMWTVAFDLAPPDRAATIRQRFQLAQPAWADPNATTVIDDGSAVVASVGYWPAIGLAEARSNRGAADGFASIDAAALEADLQWPFHTGNAGQMLLLATLIRG